MDTVIYSESWRIVNQKREKPQSMKAPLEKPQGNHVHLAQVGGGRAYRNTDEGQRVEIYSTAEAVLQ